MLDESRRDLGTHMELWVTTPDVNQGKLVPLEVYGTLQKAKITKKYISMSKRGVPNIVGKLKKKAFQQAKE